MMEVLPEAADRAIERTLAYLHERELERMRLLDACALAAMGFSL